MVIEDITCYFIFYLFTIYFIFSLPTIINKFEYLKFKLA